MFRCQIGLRHPPKVTDRWVSKKDYSVISYPEKNLNKNRKHISIKHSEDSLFYPFWMGGFPMEFLVPKGTRLKLEVFSSTAAMVRLWRRLGSAAEYSSQSLLVGCTMLIMLYCIYWGYRISHTVGFFLEGIAVLKNQSGNEWGWDGIKA